MATSLARLLLLKVGVFHLGPIADQLRSAEIRKILCRKQ